MSATLEPTPRAGDTWRWWESRRLRYNIGLAIAGALAWGLFALEVMAFQSVARTDEFYITLSLTMAQGLAWLLAMGVANILFLLGPVSETVYAAVAPSATTASPVIDTVVVSIVSVTLVVAAEVSTLSDSKPPPVAPAMLRETLPASM